MRHLWKLSMLALVAAMLVAAPSLVFAGYGGGGVSLTPTEKGFQEWTPSELKDLFGNLKPSDQKEMTEMFTGAKIPKRQLMEFRQSYLEKDMKKANKSADRLNTVVVILEVADELGNKSQQALGFVPGVGWVTSAGLGAARSAADAYKKGGDAKEIAKQAFSGGLVNGLIGKFSNADKAFNSAKAGFNLASRSMNEQVIGGGLKVAVKGISRFGLKKYGEMEGGAALQAGLNDFVDNLNNNQVPNQAPKTTYTPGMGIYNAMPELAPKK